MPSKPVLVDLDFGGIARPVNLQNPVDPGDAATKAYVDSAVEGLAWKDSVRVSTATNINLASPGATLDGVTMALNDRVLVRAQSVASQNGIYVWNGAAVPMVRSADASTFAELEQATTTVEEGTTPGATFRQTQVNGTLGSSDVLFTSFGTAAPAASESTAGVAEIATQAEVDAGVDTQRFVTPAGLANWSGRPRRFATTFGDGSATAYTITHNFNTRDVHVSVYQATGTFDEVMCEVEYATVNTVVLRFNAAPAANALRAVVLA